MRKNFVVIATLTCLLSVAKFGSAQAIAPYSSGNLQVGGGFSVAATDFSATPVGNPFIPDDYIAGFTGYADYDLNRYLGAEAEFHILALLTSKDRAELSTLVGPKVMASRGRFTFYGKALVGLGDLYIQEQQDNNGVPSGTSVAYAYGVGLDIQYSPNIVIRAFDLENQHWPSYATGISPTVVTIGAAYRFH